MVIHNIKLNKSNVNENTNIHSHTHTYIYISPMLYINELTKRNDNDISTAQIMYFKSISFAQIKKYVGINIINLS